MFKSKGSCGYGEPKNVIAVSVQKTHSSLRASKLPGLVYRRMCSRMEIWENWGLPISEVPCLHQVNVYIKRKLRVWGAKKCNRCVGAENALVVRGVQTTRLRLSPHVLENGNLGKLGATYPKGTVFAPRQCLYQKEATGMGSLKM